MSGRDRCDRFDGEDVYVSRDSHSLTGDGFDADSVRRPEVIGALPCWDNFPDEAISGLAWFHFNR